MRRTPDQQERIRLGKQLMRSQAENLYATGAVGGTFTLAVVRDRLHNVPGDGALLSWSLCCLGLHHPEQFYIQEEE